MNFLNQIFTIVPHCQDEDILDVSGALNNMTHLPIVYIIASLWLNTQGIFVVFLVFPVFPINHKANSASILGSSCIVFTLLGGNLKIYSLLHSIQQSEVPHSFTFYSFDACKNRGIKCISACHLKFCITHSDGYAQFLSWGTVSFFFGDNII